MDEDAAGVQVGVEEAVNEQQLEKGPEEMACPSANESFRYSAVGVASWAISSGSTFASTQSSMMRGKEMRDDSSSAALRRRRYNSFGGITVIKLLPSTLQPSQWVPCSSSGASTVLKRRGTERLGRSTNSN